MPGPHVDADDTYRPDVEALFAEKIRQSATTAATHCAATAAAQGP